MVNNLFTIRYNWLMALIAASAFNYHLVIKLVF